MNNDYDRLLREYNVPPGALTNEELRMLREGGIRLDDSDGEGYDDYPIDRNTQPRLPRYQPHVENESIRQVYEEQLSMK